MKLLNFLFMSILSLSVSSPNACGKKTNPFTAKASAIRYWNEKVSNKLPKPEFLFNKASPLGPTESATLSRLANDHNSLTAHLDSFCSLAGLFCSFDDSVPKNSVVSNKDADFTAYTNRNFANYGTSKLGGLDSFKNYSAELNSPNDSFRRYSRDSASRTEKFTSYATDSNVAVSNFTSYASSATGGSGEFTSYHRDVNVPNLRFSTYDSDANGHRLGFSSYAAESNSGSGSFLSYGKDGNGAPNGFESYADGANTVSTGFTSYGDNGNGANDTFKNYGLDGNNPRASFRSYGDGGNSGSDEFRSYRNKANVGSDSFVSYARNANSGKTSFVEYGKSFNLGNDSFKEYGKQASGRTSVGFRSYTLGRVFKDYAKDGVVFSEYDNFTTTLTKRVESGKFFRENCLKEGTIMAMPDISDKMPKRSFLPRFLSEKIPFGKKRIQEVKNLFHARAGSATERVISDAAEECERAPSSGERKLCVGSTEDMIDFAVSVLGSDVAVRATESVNGSRSDILIGKVRAIDGEEVVSCHQTLYPYLLYYCHSVPRARAYVAEILHVATRERMNRGVAVCHLDTSAWAPGHGAFVALGSKPGEIEVCHWIFENDMSWTLADH